MRRVKRYKLEVSYTISAAMYEVCDDGSDLPDGRSAYGSGTNERLSIQDSFDLANAVALTDVLAKIDQVHQVIKADQ